MIQLEVISNNIIVELNGQTTDVIIELQPLLPATGGTFNPLNYDLEDFTNVGADPFVKVSELPNGTTNLGYFVNQQFGVVTSDTGTDALIPLANNASAGLFSSLEKIKLAGIETNAEVNVNADWNAVSGDAQILNKPSLNFLSNNVTNYTNATLPLDPTNTIIVEQGGAYKKVAVSEFLLEKTTTNTTVSGSYAIDYNIEIHRLTLTGNTTFTETNLPPTGKGKTITLEINGNFGVVLPSSFLTYLSGSYNGTATLNTIVIEAFDSFRKVQISQPD